MAAATISSFSVQCIGRCSSSPSRISYVSAAAASIPVPISRLQMTRPAPISIHHQNTFTTISKQSLSTVVKAASSDIDSTSPEGTSPSAVEASVAVENLPLESKEQLKLDQKLKMKLAKKIRLRRKRLVRKRQMRKKGRWPPSKVKKNKNV